LVAFVVLLFQMIHKVPGISVLFSFVLPAALLSGLLLAREIAGSHRESSERFIALAKMVVPFSAGLLLPIAILLIPFLRVHAVHDLTRGILAVPALAIQFTLNTPGGPLGAVAIIPILLPLILAYDSRGRARVVSSVILMVLAGAMVFFAAKSLLLY